MEAVAGRYRKSTSTAVDGGMRYETASTDRRPMRSALTDP